MAILRLIAEGVGPFDKLDLDFSDGNGRPHLGPHILAGVNGSGKSTVLRTIAWVLDRGRNGFPLKEWRTHLYNHNTFALLSMEMPRVQAAASQPSQNRLHSWISNQIGNVALNGGRWEVSGNSGGQDPTFLWYRSEKPRLPIVAAAYSPSRVLQFLEKPDPSAALTDSAQDAFSFEKTVKNEQVQAWLLNLISGRAIALTHQRHSDADAFERTLARLRAALASAFGEDVDIDVELRPVMRPLIGYRGTKLNLSQIADGVRNVLGWLSDFINRLELSGAKTGILLIDEIDAHLHPRWQRQILPALRQALPEVQIIVSTHSPFVISSCKEARIHVLDLGRDGRARANPPQDAPFGQSINATLKDIFEVDSRFDIQTEAELNEWNALKRREAVGRLSPADRRRLACLTKELSDRSEELRLIVGLPRELSASLLHFPKNLKRKAKRQSPEKSVR